MKFLIVFLNVFFLWTQVAAASTVSEGSAPSTVPHVLTFKEALTSAYNLTYLKSAQYDIQGGYEGLSSAKREWLPSAALQSSYAADFMHIRSDQSYGMGATPAGSTLGHQQQHSSKNSLTLSQNVFSGGRTSAGIRGQERLLDKAFAAYSKQEAVFLFRAIKSYSDLVLKKLVYGVRLSNRKLLEEQVSMARSSNELGANTISDVAQVEAKLAKVKASITTSKAEVAAAKATFERFTGIEAPLSLEDPSLPLTLPKDKGEALQWAFENNQDLRIAEAEAAALQEGVTQEQGKLLPSVDVDTSVSKNISSTWGKSGFSKNNIGQFEAVARMSVPLDFRGSLQAGLRKQKYEAAKKRVDAINARRAVVESVTAKWEAMVAKKRNIDENQDQVKAAKTAFDCMKEEFTAGMKTTLHLLSAEQEYFTAQIELLVAQQEHLQACYELLQEIGLLSAQSLGLPVQTFNPQDVTVPVWGLSIKE